MRFYISLKIEDALGQLPDITGVSLTSTISAWGVFEPFATVTFDSNSIYICAAGYYAPPANYVSPASLQYDLYVEFNHGIFLIGSNGAGNTASVTVNENSVDVTTLEAGDPDGTPTTPTYSIVGGEDAALFELIGDQLKLRSALDYEAGDNQLVVIVEANDGNGATDRQTITVNIANVVGAVISSDDVLIRGTDEDDTITGGAGNNRIEGGAAADLIDGGAGGDTLVGGVDNDIYVIDSLSDSIVELAGEGRDTVRTTLTSYTLADEVEDLTFTGTGAFRGTGNTLANKITSGTGYDTLAGGAGDDTYVIDSRYDRIVEKAGEGRDTVLTTLASHTLSAEVENFTFTGTGAFSGTGNTLANVITGGAGANRLNGGAANDTFTIDASGGGGDAVMGGGGIDTVNVTGADGVSLDLAASSVEVFIGGAGNDTANGSAATGPLTIRGNGGDDVATGGSANDNIDGGAGNDSLTGGGGSDRLTGGLGADSFSGGEGNDTLYIDADDTSVDAGAGFDIAYVQGAAGVALNLATASVERFIGASGNDTADGSAASAALSIYGNAGSDSLTGGSVNDLLDGGAGNDTLSGGAGNDRVTGGLGADQLHGGDGNDTIYMDADDTEVTGGAGTDRVVVQGSAGVTLDMAGAAVERFDGGNGNDAATAGTDGVTLLGNGGNDTLTGGSGRDVLDGGANDDVLAGGDDHDRLTGGAGADTLDGGAGNDILYVDQYDEVIAGGDGIDTVIMSGSGPLSIFLASALVERVIGSGGDDVFNGAGAFVALNLQGGGGNDVLQGGEAADLINGGVGSDTITGGAGSDQLTGGLGADVFVFGSSLFPNSTAISGTDRITDFNAAEDSFSLTSGALASLANASGILDAADFFSGALSAASGQHIIYDAAAGRLYYDADGAGTGDAAVMLTFLAPNLALTNAHFQVGVLSNA